MLEEGRDDWPPWPWHLQKTVVVSRGSVRGQVKDTKRRQSKSPRRLLRRMRWNIRLSLSPNPRKRNVFSRRKCSGVILKRQLAVEVFPRGRNLSPKRNQLATDPEGSGNKSAPKKKKTFSSREEPLSR